MEGKINHWWAVRWLDAWSRAMPISEGNQVTSESDKAAFVPVEDIKVTTDGLLAQLIGSKTRPIRVAISLRPFSTAEWEAVLNIIATKASFAAALLNNSLPEEIEHRLNEVGLSLFPKITGLQGIGSCSCSRQSAHSDEEGGGSHKYNPPCSHLSAVIQHFARLIDRNPLLLFALKGMNKQQLFFQLRSIRSEHFQHFQHSKRSIPKTTASADAKRHNPEVKIDAISTADDVINPLPFILELPETAAAVLTKTKDPRFWTKSVSLSEQLSPIYQQVSERAVRIALFNGRHNNAAEDNEWNNE